MGNTMNRSTNRCAQTFLLASEALSGIGFVGVTALAACILGSASSVKPAGTDFCLPGQNGVLSCPCKNTPVGSGGCRNFGAGVMGPSAMLSALGIASVTDGFDTLQFQVTDGNGTTLTVFLQSTGASAGSAYGAGVSCLSGPTMMLYHGDCGRGEPLGQITRPLVGIDPSVHQRSAAMGDAISAGQTRYYMAGYRDREASEIAHCNDPSKTFTSTQGVSVVWGP